MRFWLSVLGYGLVIGLAVAATIASFRFVRPVDCQRVCVEPAQAPCPTGACRFGEQRAGLPFAMVRDAETGSPTANWGKLGEEDYLYLNPVACLGNVLFYGAGLWLLWKAPLALARRPSRRELVRMAPPLAYVGAGLLVGWGATQPPPAWRPPPTDEAASAILGTWQGHDSATGEAVTLRFYDDQSVTWRRGSDPFVGGGAAYSWVDAATVQISFVERRPGTEGMCASIPAVLAEACQAQLFRPNATPEAGQSAATDAAAPQRAQADAQAAPTPTLPPYDLLVSTLDAVLTVSVDATTLTLRAPSGAAQSLQRVTGER